ncbi:MAG: YceI family protein [Armatimonadetes bacterium]|nr:YceI family protein [Armatimonadota bacterium]
MDRFRSCRRRPSARRPERCAAVGRAAFILLAGVSAADILSPIAPAVPAARPAIPTAAVAATAAERFAIVPAESRVAYHVGETLLNEGNRFNVAVGITNVVRGDIVIDRAAPQNSRVGTISVEISQFRSDSPRRDRAIRERWLESARFSIAEFAPTAVRGLPQTYAEGREVTLEITGNLKIRDVAKPTTFTTTLKLERTIVSGVATAKILMTDFGFNPPVIFGILRAENEVKLEFHFTARRAP